MDTVIITSKKRMLLALYADIIIISMIYGFFSIFVLNMKDVPIYINLVLLLIVEALLSWNIGSPGMRLLGISMKKVPVTDENGNTMQRRVICTDPDLYCNEKWYTVFIGMLLLLEGSKKMIRWAQWTPPQPFLNIQTDNVSFAIISIVTGLLLMYSGYLFLKLDIKGTIISALILLADLVTIVLHWNRWDELARIEIVNRRQYQGRPVDGRQIEFIQSLTPEWLIAFTAVLLLAILFCVIAFKIKRTK